MRTEILEVEEENDTLKKVPKAPKVSTIDKTFDLWQRKRTVAEIADERKLSVQTISQHIGKLVGQQKIDITEVLSKKKIGQLEKLFQNHKSETLTEIKAEAPDTITWDDLRIYKAYLGTKDKTLKL